MFTAADARKLANKTQLQEKRAIEARKKELQDNLKKLRLKVKKEIAPNVFMHICDQIKSFTIDSGKMYFVTDELHGYIYLDDCYDDTEPGSVWKLLAKEVAAMLKQNGFKVTIFKKAEWAANTRFRINY